MDQDPPIIERARRELRARRGISGYLQAIRDLRHTTGTFSTYGFRLPLWKRGVADGLSPNDVARAYLATVLRSWNPMDWDLAQAYLQLTSPNHVPRVDVMPADLAGQVSVTHRDELLDDAPTLHVADGSLTVSTKWNGTTTIAYGNPGWLFLAVERARNSLERYRYQASDSNRALLWDSHEWELVAFRQDFSRLPSSAPLLVMAAPADLTIQLHASDAASGSTAGVAIRMGMEASERLLEALRRR